MKNYKLKNNCRFACLIGPAPRKIPEKSITVLGVILTTPMNTAILKQAGLETGKLPQNQGFRA
ncbi:MAG: hypothetical protein GWN88_11105 [Nitrospinaceae bacterium]|nr:hypothetical protein [Nitrospinaceae bacterium]NIU44731.1 hypothetical protein [Nitrospinaceae bacterium]NIU96832.1 hypothetical protein [Nitrospinaceae bacterium]NIW59421.1 hypothetical protein [Nitrospinaceae bacterium]